MNQTPDTENTERAERAAGISDLRALADMLENEPLLSVPFSFSGAVYMPRVGGDESVSVAEVFAAAEKLGTAVTFNQSEGIVGTVWQRGIVSYQVYARVTRPEPSLDTITVTSVSQVLPTASAIAAVAGALETGDEQRGVVA